MLPLLLCTTLVPSASAAEVTELPPFLRGDVSVGYNLGLLTGSMREGDGTVGRLGAEDHVLRLGAAFGVAPGAAIYAELPIYVQQRVVFNDTYTMAFDPNQDLGSLAYGDLVDGSVVRSGSGAGGAWLGAKGTPFTEALWPLRNNRATWLIDVGVRLPDATSFWAEDWSSGEPTRGAGPGAAAFRLTNAFSTTKGVSQPYMRVTWLRQGATSVDLYSSSGELVTADAQITPADSLDVLTGVQVRTFENPTSGAAFDLDFRLGFNYMGPAELPSGVYLPSVLPNTEGLAISRSEYSSASVGLGFYWRMFKYLKLDVVGDVAYVMPHTLEHAYAVRTGPDTLNISALARLNVLIR